MIAAPRAAGRALEAQNAVGRATSTGAGLVGVTTIPERTSGCSWVAVTLTKPMHYPHGTAEARTRHGRRPRAAGRALEAQNAVGRATCTCAGGTDSSLGRELAK